MEEEFQDFSKIPLRKEQISRILTSPEGQALIRLLQQDGGKGLRQASESLRRGDASGVQAALSPLLENPESARLADQLREKL